MCYFLLLPNGKVISRATVTAVTLKKLEDPEVKADIAKFDRDVSNRIDGVQGQQLTGDWHGTKQDLDLIYADEEPVMYMEDPPEGPPPAPDWIRSEADDYTPEAFDTLLSAQVQLPLGGEMKRGTVVNRKRDHNGNPVGIRHDNPMLDTRVYEVEFSNGNVGEFTANMIAENIYASVDAEGNEHVLFDEIIDHKKDKSAVTIDNMYFSSEDRSNPKPRGPLLIGSYVSNGKMAQPPGSRSRN